MDVSLNESGTKSGINGHPRLDLPEIEIQANSLFTGMQDALGKSAVAAAEIKNLVARHLPKNGTVLIGSHRAIESSKSLQIPVRAHASSVLLNHSIVFLNPSSIPVFG